MLKKGVKKGRKKPMLVSLGVLLIIIGAVLVWFYIPYSPMKQQFSNDLAGLKSEGSIYTGEVFTENDFKDMPQVIQKYIEYCGYIGKPKMPFLTVEFHNVKFMQGRDGPALKMDYMNCNTVKQSNRIALMNSSIFGAPFEGYDYYIDGKGGMKGVIGKAITLFHQTGAEMDKGGLVTYLGECLVMPSSLLQDFITLEEISDLRVKSTITYYGISVSGIFTFNEAGEATSFYSEDRPCVTTDGSVESVGWSELYEDYQLDENGIKYPTHLKAIWNYEDGDFVYFDGKISSISYD